MMLPLRLCYLKAACVLDEECNIPGGNEISRQNRELTYSLLSGFNLSTIAKEPEVNSDFDEKKIDECLYSLQRNESDIIFTTYSMPVLLENISTSAVTGEGKVGFVSTYEFEDYDNRPGILGTFHAFSLETCSLIISCTLIMFALVVIASIVRRQRVHGVAGLIFSYFVKQFHSWPGKRRRMSFSKRILNCCLLLFSFSVTFSYISMIKTEMVTVKTPKVIASYQDIVDDPQIEPFMDYLLDEYRLFRTASKGSLKNKIWSRMVRLGMDKHLANSGKDGMEMQDKLLNRKAVIIAYDYMLYAAKYMATILAKKSGKKFLLSFDPSEQPVISAYVYNSLMPQEIYVKFSKKIRRYGESALHQQVIDIMAKIGVKLFKSLMNMDSDISDVDSYVSERVLLPHPVVVKADLQYFSYFFILFVVFCVFAFVILIIEIILHKMN